jgi:hypothetical protein
MSNKKIAICFSGYPRFVSESFDSISKNLLERIGDFDIFANLQWDENLIGKKIHHEFDKVYERNEIDDFTSLYREKIKSIKINKPFEYDASWLNVKSNAIGPDVSLEENREILYRLKSQYYGIYECLNMIPDLDDYSFVIRMRTDLILNREIRPDEIFSDSIVNQSGYCAGHDRRFSDWFFCCPTEFVDFFKDLSDLETHFNEGVMHMHLLIDKLSKKYPIIERDLEIDTPNTSTRIKRF